MLENIFPILFPHLVTTNFYYNLQIMDNVQISQSRPWILRARCQHSVLFVFHRDYNENGVGQLTIEVGSQDMNWSRSGASAPNPEESLFSHDKGTRVTLDDEFSMGKCSCWSF